ncbi:MAG: glutamate--tRNA ligase [Phycisphaerae bacterium]
MTAPDHNRTTVRVRFAPSPTGYLHVGGARTVLFNWLLARKSGGALILRIEDTDRRRHVDDAVANILDDLRWLGLTWDEGPDVGGAHGPYCQSERLDRYNTHIQRLLESGDAYYTWETPEALQAMRDAARAEKRNVAYVRPDPTPTIEAGKRARADGRPVVVRFKMPDADITVADDILGDVTITADRLEDFVIQKSDGYPTYHLACVVDDALMNITHVLRGQEHLMNTPKHVAIQRALGVPTPRYAHLPIIVNMDGSKMSKRDKAKAVQRGERPPEIDVHDFRVAGYLPEALLNFIALLGWSPGDDREHLSLDDMVSAFTIDRIGKTSARFDRQKLVARNTAWVAAVSPDRRLDAFCDYLTVNRAATPVTPTAPDAGPPPVQAARATPTGVPVMDRATCAKVLDACGGFRTFADVLEKTRFLFTPDDAIRYEPKAVKKALSRNDGAGYAMLASLQPRLDALAAWTPEALEAVFAAVCRDRDTKLGNVAQPVRVAVTGTLVSPSIYDTLVLLGKQRTLARIARCLAHRPAPPPCDI